MHDTAFKIGCLAFNKYCNKSSSKIMEVGSYNVNGSLRDYVDLEHDYVGIDFSSGPGVDIVVKSGEYFPVEDNDFDFVFASSALEHDFAFWNTFVQMCQKTNDGGHIYINVPSNGVVHRYPQDCWRFYPDAGRALVSWAKSQGQDITLVESFVANRENDIWNDFVAIFRKGTGVGASPATFLYELIPSYNVLLGDDGETLNSIAETEDMRLASQAQSHASELNGVISEAQNQIVRLTTEIEQKTKRNDIIQYQDDTDNNAILDRICALSREVEALIKHNEMLTQQNMASQNFILDLEAVKQAAEIKAVRVEEALEASTQATHAAIHARVQLEETQKVTAEQLHHVEALLQGREAEIAALIMDVSKLEQKILESEVRTNKFEWLLQVGAILLTPSSWWEKGLFTLIRRRQLNRLAGTGLFDAERYYELHPDVRAENVDPLRHYVIHGISEGRAI